MKHVHLTWYVLVDGTHADPNDVAPDKDGVLRHKSGLAVALHEDGTPMSVGKGAVENMNVEAAEAAEGPAPAPVETAEMKPEETPEEEPKAEQSTRKGRYKTRESKAR